MPMKVFALLAVGVWACSTSVIMLRVSTTPPAVLSGLRLILAVGILFPFFFNAWKGADQASRRASFTGTFFPGLALAAHFIFWTLGARMTETASATLIVNLAPLAMPFLLWITQREKVHGREWFGTLLALAGILVLVQPWNHKLSSTFMGEGACFVAMLLLALYLALGRLNRRVSSLWLYLVPVYAWAGVLCLLAAIPLHPGLALPSGIDWLWLVLLAVMPTVFGHGLLNYALRHLGGQVVSIANQGQFLFAAPMAFVFFGEKPAFSFYPAAVLMVLGCCVAIWQKPQKV